MATSDASKIKKLLKEADGFFAKAQKKNTVAGKDGYANLQQRYKGSGDWTLGQAQAFRDHMAMLAAGLTPNDRVNVNGNTVNLVWAPLIRASYAQIAANKAEYDELRKQGDPFEPDTRFEKAVANGEFSDEPFGSKLATKPVESFKSYEALLRNDVRGRYFDYGVIDTLFKCPNQRVNAALVESYSMIRKGGTLSTASAYQVLSGGKSLPAKPEAIAAAAKGVSNSVSKSTVRQTPPAEGRDTLLDTSGPSTTTMLLLGLGGLALIYWFTQQKGTAPAATPAAATGG